MHICIVLKAVKSGDSFIMVIDYKNKKAGRPEKNEN
jgi:hypothetical protein